jgi:hypothetical protein
MANKFVAVFLMCIVVVAAFSIHEAKAGEYDDEKFKACFNTCHKECSDEGNGYTFCEMKCDTDCGNKEAAGKSYPNFDASLHISSIARQMSFFS